MHILLLLLTLMTPAVAQKNLGRESFMVNVRPVLSGIVSDFYQMVALFPDFPKNILPLMRELDDLTSDKETLKQTCPRTININCKGSVNSLKARLSRIRELSLRLFSEQKMSKALYINSISALRIISEFDAEVEEAKGHIDNTSFLLSAGIPQKKETYFILKELDELMTLASLSVVEYIPFLYKEDFKHFFFNFVNPLQQQISKNSNHEFLNRNINSLNYSINLLNQTLTKKKKTPEGMGPFLSVIHNRWNSILRYYY